MSISNAPQVWLQDAIRLHRGGELERAAGLYERVIKAAPDNANALHLFGLVRHQLGAHAEGARYIRRAVDLVPDQPVLRNNLGDALRMAGEPRAAIEQLLTALSLRPDYAGAHLNLCAAFSAIKDFDAALRHGETAVRLAPDHAEAHFNLGLARLDAVALEDAAASFREVLRRDPEHPGAISNLLYLLNLIPGLDPQAVAAEHRRIGARWDHVGPTSRTAATRQPEQALRIGYLSRDLRAHAVSHFVEPVLAQHDRKRFQVWCYCDVDQPDAVTERLRGLADQWREVAGWTDRRLLDQLRQDQIDILVDLGGHTEKNRLALFAHKPAPVQISWIGYPNTTGMAAMDFRIVDTHSAQTGEPGHEALLRLPRLFASYRPHVHAPDVSRLPAELSGQLTFGSLHRMEKLNRAVIDLWSRLLHAVPQARLLIARDELDPWQQRRIELAFARHGIDGERLLLRQLDGSRSFLDEYADIDIHLDVFPWSGHTIACSALWQGVPVITLAGRSHVGRMVSSVLTAVGLAQLVATDEAEYVRIAVDLAADIPALAALRAGLRERLAASPLRDERQFTDDLESAYLQAWAARQ